MTVEHMLIVVFFLLYSLLIVLLAMRISLLIDQYSKCTNRKLVDIGKFNKFFIRRLAEL